MPHAKFNWRCGGGGAGGEGGAASASSTSPANPDGTYSFAFGETWKLTNHTLSKGENGKGCTLDVMLEHDSKVSQLQLVCSASALQVSVVQKMNAQDFKWLTQMRGTPLPNQPDMFYFRTPEELLTQKIWRLRVKFLFASASVAHVKMQSLSLCFDKLTRRGSGAKGASLPYGGVPLLMGAPSGSGKPHLYRGGSASTVTSTTASLSTTPTGTCTPNGSDNSLCEDMSELSLHGSDAGDGCDAQACEAPASARTTQSARSSSAWTSSLQLSRPATATATAAASVPSSSASVSSARSSASSSSSHHRRRTTGSGCGSPPPPSSSSSSSDRAAVRQLLAVIDQVLAGRGGASAALAAELTALKGQLAAHLQGERLSDEELTRTVARIGSVVQSLASG